MGEFISAVPGIKHPQAVKLRMNSAKRYSQQKDSMNLP
jgi:hypothetical protein